MSVVLRSINLLDGQFTQVSKAWPTNTMLVVLNFFLKKKQDAFVKRIIHEDTPKTKPKPTLKRRVGYSEEEISSTRAKLASMAIDEDHVEDLLNNSGAAV